MFERKHFSKVKNYDENVLCIPFIKCLMANVGKNISNEQNFLQILLYLYLAILTSEVKFSIFLPCSQMKTLFLCLKL